MKIDTSTIQGFDGMTAEDKVNALLNLDVQGSDNGELAKLKTALSKANTEAANYKRQITERMTAEEKAKAEREEQENAIKQELETLKRSNSVYENQAKALELGYSSENAKAFANAMADGDTDALYKIIANQREIDKAAITAELAKNAPRPEGKSGESGKDDAVTLAETLAAKKTQSYTAQAQILEKFLK